MSLVVLGRNRHTRNRRVADYHRITDRKFLHDRGEALIRLVSRHTRIRSARHPERVSFPRRCYFTSPAVVHFEFVFAVAVGHRCSAVGFRQYIDIRDGLPFLIGDLTGYLHLLQCSGEDLIHLRSHYVIQRQRRRLEFVTFSLRRNRAAPSPHDVDAVRCILAAYHRPARCHLELYARNGGRAGDGKGLLDGDKIFILHVFCDGRIGLAFRLEVISFLHRRHGALPSVIDRGGVGAVLPYDDARQAEDFHILHAADLAGNGHLNQRRLVVIVHAVAVHLGVHGTARLERVPVLCRLDGPAESVLDGRRVIAAHVANHRLARDVFETLHFHAVHPGRSGDDKGQRRREIVLIRLRIDQRRIVDIRRAKLIPLQLGGDRSAPVIRDFDAVIAVLVGLGIARQTLQGNSRNADRTGDEQHLWLPRVIFARFVHLGGRVLYQSRFEVETFFQRSDCI